MNDVGELIERLQEHHRRTQETPLFNPVFQLGLDLSRQLESGELDLDRVEGLVAELECDSMQSRATRLRRLVAPVANEANTSELKQSLASGDFDAFKRDWESPQLHAVFTAHPTFLLSPDQSEAVADAASSDDQIDDKVCIIGGERPQVTLTYEHGITDRLGEAPFYTVHIHRLEVPVTRAVSA